MHAFSLIFRGTLYSVQMEREGIIRKLDHAVNHEKADEFHVPFLGHYHFSADVNSGRFSLHPSCFQSGVIIEGFTEKKKEGECCVYVRLMPPMWFLFFFIWIPCLILVQIPADEKWMLLIFWLIFSHLITLMHLRATIKLFEGIDRFFESIDAVSVSSAGITPVFLRRRIGLYFMIALGYIAALLFLGCIGSLFSN